MRRKNNTLQTHRYRQNRHYLFKMGTKYFAYIEITSTFRNFFHFFSQIIFLGWMHNCTLNKMRRDIFFFFVLQRYSLIRRMHPMPCIAHLSMRKWLETELFFVFELNELYKCSSAFNWLKRSNKCCAMCDAFMSK